jgi:hypothetical protein
MAAPTPIGHFLAHQEDPIVALHLFAERLVERVAVGQRCHYAGSAYTSV